MTILVILFLVAQQKVAIRIMEKYETCQYTLYSLCLILDYMFEAVIEHIWQKGL